MLRNISLLRDGFTKCDQKMFQVFKEKIIGCFRPSENRMGMTKISYEQTFNQFLIIQSVEHA